MVREEKMGLRKNRLDRMLVEKGLIASRERAKALIMKGAVYVNGFPVLKPGTIVADSAVVEIKSDDIPYVSRGGVKLEAAIRGFNVDIRGKTAMDIGSSTGGFTDCLLQHGARKVYCIDVGYGQLAWKLRQDERVVIIERTNIRYMPLQRIPEDIDIVVIDVSFISLIKVIPKAIEFMNEGGEIVALIKPQFEVGKGEVNKGGVIRDEEKRLKAVEQVCQGLKSLNLMIRGIMQSPILGSKGNVEYFIHLSKKAPKTGNSG